jgi:hypothetical protein
VVYDWHHGDGGIHEGANDDRGQDDVRDGVVDGEEGYDEACQEEEDGDVKKGRDGLNGDGHMEAAHTLGKERSDVGTLVDCDLRLRQLEVSAGPALLERCE